MATVQIWVELDKDATNSAKVKLESRDKKVPSGDKIKWHKRDNNDDFVIIHFHPQDDESPFKEVDIARNGRKIECDFEPGNADSDTKFSYTLWVESGGEVYDTTDRSLMAEDGKPVIRN